MVEPAKPLQRIRPVPKLTKEAGPRGADLNTGREKTFPQAVIAERALGRYVLLRVDPPGSIRAGLDAVSAADAVVFVHQDHSVGCGEGGPNRTNLNTGCVTTVVAQLGDEEGSEDVGVGSELGEAVDSPVRAVHPHLPVGLNDVTLNPGVEETLFVRNIVFDLAGHGTTGASNALLGVHPHGVEGLTLRHLSGFLAQELIWSPDYAKDHRCSQGAPPKKVPAIHSGLGGEGGLLGFPRRPESRLCLFSHEPISGKWG
jgi:hypothetical protein